MPRDEAFRGFGWRQHSPIALRAIELRSIRPESWLHEDFVPIHVPLSLRSSGRSLGKRARFLNP